MNHEDLTIETAQREQPWVVPYAYRHRHDVGDFRSSFLAKHTVLHAMKTVGKLAAIYEAVDHSDLGPVPSDAQINQIQGLAADLLSAALKLAQALIARVLEKNGRTYGESKP